MYIYILSGNPKTSKTQAVAVKLQPKVYVYRVWGREYCWEKERKGENCSWNLYSCYCLSQSTVIVLAELDVADGWGERELWARSLVEFLVEIFYFKDSGVKI